ncbi:hypothetical protein GGR53DRAFT_516549 [Hypoxylon sp. FL1150]|nr:hypothetical protein GGR53DRAFT_516549 [Hypoxylon sp. FL1150]
MYVCSWRFLGAMKALLTSIPCRVVSCRPLTYHLPRIVFFWKDSCADGSCFGKGCYERDGGTDETRVVGLDGSHPYDLGLILYPWFGVINMPPCNNLYHVDFRDLAPAPNFSNSGAMPKQVARARRAKQVPPIFRRVLSNITNYGIPICRIYMKGLLA